MTLRTSALEGPKEPCTTTLPNRGLELILCLLIIDDRRLTELPQAPTEVLILPQPEIVQVAHGPGVILSPESGLYNLRCQPLCLELHC